MAQKVRIHLEDDLSTANAERLREALRPFVAAARKASTGTVGRCQRGTRSSSSSGKTAVIRAWARSTATRSPTASASTRRQGCLLRRHRPVLRCLVLPVRWGGSAEHHKTRHLPYFTVDTEGFVFPVAIGWPLQPAWPPAASDAGGALMSPDPMLS